MKLRPFSMMALICLSSLALPAAGVPELVRLAAEGWTQAAVKQDRAGLERFLAPDLQYAHAGGKTQTREEYIGAVTQGPPRYESFLFSGTEVRVYGKAAVLTGYVDVKMTGQNSFRVRTLQVYVRNGGQWQMTAHQSTRLAN